MSTRIPLLDAAVVIWAIVWVVLGFRVADEMRGLTELSGTVIEVGVAVESAGAALGTLADVPLAGDRIEEPSEDIRAAGRSAVASGRSSRESISDLSTLLGFAVAIIPTVPLLAFWLPVRIGWQRDRRALARLLRDAPDPAVADRVVLDRLVAEELRRLGLTRQRTTTARP